MRISARGLYLRKHKNSGQPKVMAAPADTRVRARPVSTSVLLGWKRSRCARRIADVHRIGIGWILLALVPSLTFSQTRVSSPSVSIQTGLSRTATQHVDEPITYQFLATAGQSYLIVVEQEGLDVAVTITSPAGVRRVYNSPLNRDERELVVLDATVSGPYSITLNSDELTDSVGRHTILVTAIVESGQRGAARLAALRLMSEAAAANAIATEGSAQAMLAAYMSAMQLWPADDTREYAQTLYSIAMVQYWHGTDMAQAAENAARAASTYRELQEPMLEANALSLEAAALIEAPSDTANYQIALGLLEDSRRIHERLGGGYDLAEVLYRRALTKFFMGDGAGAANDWTLAANTYRNAQEWGGELKALEQLAVIDINAGHYRSAIDRLEYIVGELSDRSEPNLLARCFDSLGIAYRELGRADDALSAFTSALAMHRSAGDGYHMAESLRGLGSTFFALGELDSASNYFRQALDQESADARTHIAAITGLGNVAFLQSDYERALLEHRSALAMTTSPADRVYRLMLVARDLNALGRFEEAIETANDARALIEELDGGPVNLADALTVLGNAHLGLHQIDAAERYLSDALAQYEGLRLEGGQAEALAGLAAAARTAGDLSTAAEYGQRTIGHIERLREQVSAPILRASFGAQHRRYYDQEIELEMDLAEASPDEGNRSLRMALTTSERSRARMTLDLVSEASAQLQRGADEQLLHRQQALREQYVELGSQRLELLASGVRSAANQTTIEDLDGQMLTVETELSLLESELRRSNTRFAEFAYIDPLSAEQMQHELVGSDSILLQYSFGKTRSFVWVVTPQSIRGVELADYAEIETAAQRVLEGLQTYSANANTRGALDNDLLRLSRYVLSPVTEFLRAKRVLIAVDGALEYIPFGVLPMEAYGNQPLVSQYEIIGIPSLSVLAEQRRREPSVASQKTIAVFADPVMTRDDPRVSAQTLASSAAIPSPTDLLTRSSFAGEQFARLPGASEEAKEIASLVPDEERLILTGVDASRQRLLATDLSEYRYIHFATHGLIDARHPALSSLLLSRFDSMGRPEDAYLRVRDVYDLNLNADVVVLSACDTALGREIRGEGLIGLTQAFMYAGARSLVVSLWKVDDRATKELMTRFYERLLGEHASPAQALRQAQMSLASERRFGHPYFWGGFILLGDWD